MKSCSNEEPEFLFKQNSQQTSCPMEQIIIQKQSKKESFVFMSNQPEDIIDEHHDKTPLQKYNNTIYNSTHLVIVQSQDKHKMKESESQIEEVVLNNNKNNQIDVRNEEFKSKQQMEQSKVLFDFEEDEEGSEEAQSSIRKLYKSMKKQEIKQNLQKLTEIQLSHEEKYYNQQENEDEEMQEYDIQDTNYNQAKKRIIASKDLQNLVNFKIPPGKMIKCLVRAVSTSFFTFQKVFQLYLAQQKKLIMKAHKRRLSISSKFTITGKERNQNVKLGFVQSNFTRTQYKLIQLSRQLQISKSMISSGFSSDIIKMTSMQPQSQQEIKYAQNEKAFLSYQSNFLGMSQQKVEIAKPKKILHKTDGFSDIKNSIQNCEFQRLDKFTNRRAQKNIQGQFVLDFKQTNIVYSTRNMIIQDEFGQASIIFAKKTDDVFILNVMHPFTLLQGFFIGICNIDRKIFVH